jgi:hypothetical protein
MTSMINTNVFFDFTDFQAARDLRRNDGNDGNDVEENQAGIVVEEEVVE